MSKPTERLEAIFEAVVALETEAQRADYLRRACPEPALRREVEALLAAHENPDSVFAEKTVRVDVAPSEAIGTVIGRYKLLEALGEGGFGSVWLAEQKEPVRRKVALKIIKAGMDTKQVVARFEAERQALALMDHPNIAKVLDAGTTDSGRPYFVMELVRGVPITKFCDENKLATRERLGLFIKVCHAVQHAHQKGIIHRDLKPSNVLVTLHDGVPIPKVIDFGIAKATQQELTDKTIHTQFQQFIGTPAYVSPEQAEMSGLDIDTRSDIYSLGVLLYELLTGMTPFNAQALMQSGLDEMRRIIREDEPKRPSTRLSALEMAEATTLSKHRKEKLPALINLVRGDLDWIVMKCLEKDRSRRYETANGLASDLARHLNNEPVVARPPSAAYRLQKAWRRNKLVFTAAAAVVAALVVGFSISLWQARVATHAKNAAQAAQLAKETEARNAQRERDVAQAARAEAEDKTKKLDASLYLNRIALAHREITARPANIQRAVRLLEECPTAMRGWEWHYLQRIWRTEPSVAGNFGTKELLGVSYSPDGHWLAVAGGDGKIRILDAESLKVKQTLSGHSNYVSCVTFDPTNPDRLASVGVDTQITLWDWPTASKLHVWQGIGSGDYGFANCLAFSPDGLRLAADSPATSVTLWSTKTFEALQRIPIRGTRIVDAMCFDPAGRRLSLGQSDGTVAIWDIDQEKYVAETDRKGPPVSGIAFSRDGSSLAAVSFDSFLQVWDANSDLSQPRFRVKAHDTDAVAVTFNKEGDRLVTAGVDRSVVLWDSHTGQQVLAFQDFQDAPRSVAFSPDGSRLVSVGVDGEIHMRDAKYFGTEDQHESMTFIHSNAVTALALSPDGKFLASGGPRPDQSPNDFATLAIRHLRTGDTITNLPVNRVFVFDAVFSPDGRYLATTGDDSAQGEFVRIKIWDVRTGTEAFTVEPVEGAGVCFCLAFSPDGKRLVAADALGELKIWNALSGRKIGVTGGSYRRCIDTIVFSADGRYLVTGSNDGKIRIWDGLHLDTTQSPELELEGAPGGYGTDSLAISANSRLVIFRSGEDSATIWDMQTKNVAAKIESQSHGFHALAFSPDGRLAASGGSDCTIRLWDTQSRKLLMTFRGHRGNVNRLRFFPSPTGLRLVSASWDDTVKIWEIPL